MAKKTDTTLQAPHWVDQLTAEIQAWQTETKPPKLHVDDMKTPSGRVHTGSLRGVLLHDIVAKALAEADSASSTIVSTYVFNDMDAMDRMPHYLDPAEFNQHLGKPLHKIPPPSLENCGIDLSKASPEERTDFENANNFAEFYAFDFIHAFRKLGCTQELVWSHELYESGQMDQLIEVALENVETFRAIYQDIADYDLPEQWYPFQVFCEKCGKVRTTLVTDWNGQEVTYTCRPDAGDDWHGCGHTSTVSPFGGTGKLPWKVDWPAHWAQMGITIEGAGKDHTSAGGSRDMANAICKQVFEIPIPYDIPYEWIMIRGAKMSSSKGVGTSAREFTELFPTEVGRFLFVNKHYNSVIDFDPRTMAIPDLFDAYDEAATIFWGQAEEGADLRLGRSFELAQVGKIPEAHYVPRFRDVAVWMQDPTLDVLEQAQQAKGSALTDREQSILKERIRYAKTWVKRYAPADYQLTPKSELPAEAATMTDQQRQFAIEIFNRAIEEDWSDPQALQQAIFEQAKASLGARQGFQALYLALLGKTSGPRAGWLLLATPAELLRQRIDQLQTTESDQKTESFQFNQLNQPGLFSMDPAFAEKYPSATVGFAILKNVSVQATNPELEAEKTALLDSLAGLTTSQIGDYPEITSYRQMYKDMGVDWHSRRPSPEALLRRVAQGKELYQVNTCVDAYNLVVMKHRVSIGAFDLDQVELPTLLRIAEEGEQILLLGDDEPTTLKPGEVSYFDQTGPYNLDFNYCDAQRTKVTTDTTNLLINIDGVYDISRTQIEISLKETIDIIQKYCGGTLELAGVVTAS